MMGAEVPAPKFGEATSDVELKKQSRNNALENGQKKSADCVALSFFV